MATSSGSSTSMPKTFDSPRHKMQVYVEIPTPARALSSASGSGSSTPRPKLSESLKRKLQVFVEIPPSPVHASYMSNKRKHSALDIPISGRKGGTPLSSKALNHNRLVDTTESPLKKTKLSEQSSNQGFKKLIKKKPISKPEHFPNGPLTCHQCGRKRDALSVLHCTIFRGVRCRSKYCESCLRNRYGQDASEIRRSGVTADENLRQSHVKDESYIWQCPRCSGDCNCSICRKAKGLGPTGNLTREAKKAGTSAAALLAEDPKRVGLLPGVMKPFKLGEIDHKVAPNKALASSEVSGASKDTILLNKKSKGRPRPKKEVPEPNWTEVQTDLDLAQAETRFLIREFVLRFATIMEISAKHLEDLDEFDVLSDACAKTLIMNILDLIAADAPVDIQKTIRNSMKKISGGGFSPSSLWTNLSNLRESVPSDFLILPDPDAPTTLENRRTRTANTIIDAAQLIPVIIALAECALQGASVREEIENGARDAKDVTKEYWAASREENERWATERQKMTDEKEAKEKEPGWDASKWSKEYRAGYKKHKATLFKLDNVHTLKTQAYAPRFQPLGKDAQGRVYYVSSAYKGKKIPSAEDRRAMRKWSWFLAVWGKVENPPEKKAGNGKAGDEGSENEREERWWGFSDPGDIKHLAKWIAAKEKLDINKDMETAKLEEFEGPTGTTGSTSARTGQQQGSASGQAVVISRPQSSLSKLSDGKDGTDNERSVVNLPAAGRPALKSDLKGLVKDLNEYADFLAWRCGTSLTPAAEEQTQPSTMSKKGRSE